MIKIAVLDDYQNTFEQIIDISKYKSQILTFVVFNEAFQSENEAINTKEDESTIYYERKNSYNKKFNGKSSKAKIYNDFRYEK